MDMEMDIDSPTVTDSDVLAALGCADNADPAAKVAALDAAGSALRVSAPLPDASALLDGLRVSLRSAQQDVAATAFAIIVTYASRLQIETDAVASEPGLQAHALRLARFFTLHALSLALERLGDSRVKTRTASGEAAQALAKLVVALPHNAPGPARSRTQTQDSPLDVFTTTYIDAGLRAKQPRVREASISLLPTIKHDYPAFPIRPLTSTLATALADADAKVRDATKACIVLIFTRATPMARAELHREMEKQGIRKPLVESLMGEISGAGPGANERASSKAAAGMGANDLAAESSGFKPSIMPPVDTHTFISSAGELERLVLVMEPHFQGVETEKNWGPRQSDVAKLRGLFNHELPLDVKNALPAMARTLQDGIVKTASTLRTTLAMQSLALIEELLFSLNEELGQNGVAENFLLALLRISGGTKKMTANAAQTAISALLQCVPFRPVFFHTLQYAVTDKNVQVRIALVGHIRSLLYTYRPNSKALAATAADGAGRTRFLARSNLEAVAAALGQELVDSNKDVRAGARKAFWLLNALPAGRSEADALLNRLDAKTKGVLMNDTSAREEAEDDTNAGKRAASVTSGGSAVRRAPGGASLALLRAKRAAHARMAHQDHAGQSVPDVASAELTAPPESAIQWGEAPPSPSRQGGHEAVSPESKVQQWQREMPSSPLPAPSADVSMELEETNSPPAPIPQVLAPHPDVVLKHISVPAAPNVPAAAGDEPGTLGVTANPPSSERDDRTDRGPAADSASTLGPAVSPHNQLSAREPAEAKLDDKSLGDVSLPDQHSPTQAHALEGTSDSLQPLASKKPQRSHRRALSELESVAYWVARLQDGEPDLNMFRKMSRWASYPAQDEQGHTHPLAQDPGSTAELLQSLFNLVRTKAQAKAAEPALATLIVLHRLAVHHTIDAITLSGQQEQLVHLALDATLAREPLRYGAPCEGILSAWASQTDSVLCLRTLVGHCPSAGDESESESGSAVLKLVLQVFAILLRQMPAEVIEDELPRLREPLRTGLAHRKPDVRAAANATILAAARELQSTQGIFTVLAPLTQSQQDLILYYFAKGRGGH